MKYLCLIYNDESDRGDAEGRGKGHDGRVLRLHRRASRRAATTWAANALQPTKTATTVRVRQGKMSTTDGPFAETKEQLGGFYLIEAKDLNDAIQVASRIPAARTGSIEVRPV